MRNEKYNKNIEEIFTFKYNPRIYLYHNILRKPIILFRLICCYFHNIKKGKKLNIKIKDLTEFESEFQKKGYCFVENFLDDESYLHLLNSWPSKIYFKPMTTIFKSYDIAFKWIRPNKTPRFLNRNKTLNSFFKYIKTDDFIKKINKLTGYTEKLSAYSFLISWAKPGSALIPHMDGIADKPGGESFYNIIYFLDGKGKPEECGATAIFKSNNYDEALLRPSGVKNSALIYKSDNTYHGFEPMKNNTYRYTINFQINSKKY